MGVWYDREAFVKRRNYIIDIAKILRVAMATGKRQCYHSGGLEPVRSQKGGPEAGEASQASCFMGRRKHFQPSRAYWSDRHAGSRAGISCSSRCGTWFFVIPGSRESHLARRFITSYNTLHNGRVWVLFQPALLLLFYLKQIFLTSMSRDISNQDST